MSFKGFRRGGGLNSKIDFKLDFSDLKITRFAYSKVKGSARIAIDTIVRYVDLLPMTLKCCPLNYILVFTDEESDNAENKDEKSDDEDDDDDELEQNEYDAVMAEELGYNSEEEMVPYTSKVAEEFFEKEAELSESEWGSEDENERDLDTLEKEEGDDDEIDNEKLKEELGRIHM